MVVYVLAPESRMTGLWKMVTVGFGTLVVLSGGFWADGSAGCEAAEGFGVAAVLCSSSSVPVTNARICF